MDQYLEVSVHNEFAKRMEDEHIRQNKRICDLEDGLKETRNLALSIERLTLSVKAMVDEQKSQGERLEALENKDGEMWRKVVGHVITTAIGIIMGFIWTKIMG